MPGRKEYRSRIEKLKEMVRVQASAGTYDYDDYMFGMAQGMIYALSILDDTECNYLDRPDWFRKDYEILEKLNQSGIVLDHSSK